MATRWTARERAAWPGTAGSRFLLGAKSAWPVVMGYVPIGFAYGVLAAQAGLSPWEAGAMSLLVYAGASQFIAVGMLAADAGLAAVAATTFLVNLRHLLMSAALSPYFHRVRRPLLAVLSFFVTDESFAVSSTVFAERGRGDAGWFAGLAVTAYGSWLAASVAGALAGGIATNQEALGLDFALSAMFIGLLVPNLRGEEAGSRRVAALVAAALAVAMGLLGQPSWGVIVATVVAATVGVMLR